MHALRGLLAAAAVTAVSASAIDGGNYFSVLLKRQQPGTPAYACHDNCGQASMQARESDDVCSSDAFLSNYANCLQCSGPDNVGIWQYYGNSLGPAGEACGLDTKPLSGKQPEVGPATPAEAGGSSTPSPSTSSPLPEPTDVEPAPEPTGDEPAPKPTTPSEAVESHATSAEPPSGTDDASKTDKSADPPAETASGTDTPADGDAEESGAPAVDAAGSVRIGSFMGLFVTAVLGATLLA